LREEGERDREGVGGRGRKGGNGRGWKRRVGREMFPQRNI